MTHCPPYLNIYLLFFSQALGILGIELEGGIGSNHNGRIIVSYVHQNGIVGRHGQYEIFMQSVSAVYFFLKEHAQPLAPGDRVPPAIFEKLKEQCTL